MLNMELSKTLIDFDPNYENDLNKFNLNINLLEDKKSIEFTLDVKENSMSFTKTFSFDELKVKSKTFYNEKNLKNIFKIINDLKEKKLYKLKIKDDKCEIKFLIKEKNEDIIFLLDLIQVEYSFNFVDLVKTNKFYLQIKNEIESFKKEYYEKINYMKIEFSDVLKSIKNQFEVFKKEIEDKLFKFSNISNNNNNNIRNNNNNNIRNNNNNNNKNPNKEINNIQNNIDILDLKKEIEKIKNKINEMNSLLKKEEKNFLKDFISPNKNINFDLIFSSKEDGFDAETFHNKCNNYNNTVTVILTENNEKIGGFTSLNWEGNGIDKNDDKTFIFDLNNRKVYKKLKKDKPSIFCHENRGPMFGRPCDLGLKEDMSEGFAVKNGCFTSNLELTNEKENFKIKEIEIYTIKSIDN